MNAPSAKFKPVAPADVAHLGTAPIPARYYYDPEWFAAEREAVFRRSWLYIGHVCELPSAGSFIRRDLELFGISLLIIRGKGGAIRAFHNVCSHRGNRLVDGEKETPGGKGRMPKSRRRLAKSAHALASS